MLDNKDDEWLQTPKAWGLYLHYGKIGPRGRLTIHVDLSGHLIPLETVRWMLPMFVFVTLHCLRPFCSTKLLLIEFFLFVSVSD